MSKRLAALSFLAVCIGLAVLLVLGVITPLVSGCAFAIALVILGGLSRGFRT